MKTLSSFSRIFLIFMVFNIPIAGCKKIEDLLTFSISSECSMTINSTSPVGLPFEILTPNVTTNSSQQFKNNNSNADLVKDIRLEQLTCTITNPQGKTFSFLQSVKIFVSTNSADEIELAHLDSIPPNATTITLVSTNLKLDNYVKSSSYNLRTEAVTRETFTQNVNLQVKTKFKVTANL